MVLIAIVMALVAKAAGMVVAAVAEAVEEVVTDVMPRTRKTAYDPLLQIWIVVMRVFQIMLRFCNPTLID